MYWTPPPGHWLFHCHFVPHMSPEMTVANALADKFIMEHNARSYGGNGAGHHCYGQSSTRGRTRSNSKDRIVGAGTLG